MGFCVKSKPVKCECSIRVYHLCVLIKYYSHDQKFYVTSAFHAYILVDYYACKIRKIIYEFVVPVRSTLLRIFAY